MAGHDAIGSYNWIKISKLGKPYIPYIGMHKFCLDWALRMPVITPERKWNRNFSIDLSLFYYLKSLYSELFSSSSTLLTVFAKSAFKMGLYAKDWKTKKILNALDWLARLVTHIPSRYEKTVRYYGYYSNKSRRIRKKAGIDDKIPAVIANEMSSKKFRQNCVPD